MDNGLNAAFLKLKSICDSLATSPTEEKLFELKNTVSTIPINVLQTLHEFVLFPLFINLRLPELRTNNKLKLNLLETLQYVHEKIHLEKITTFTHLHMVLVQHIYDKNSPSLVAAIDEEQKLGIVKCLELLFRNLSMDLRYDLYTKEKSLQISQCCHVCIQIAKNEKNRALRIKAIECIMTMAYVHDDADFADKELRSKVADVMMSFLPGITIGLKDIAVGDVKQGHKITALSIKALSRIIVLHLQDNECTEDKTIVFEYPPKMENSEDVEIIHKKKQSIEDMVYKFKNASRNEKWYKDTGIKLKIIIELIIPLQHHDHPKVRNQISELCEEILMHCCQNMNNSVDNCIEVLIALSEDDSPEIANRSKLALEKIMKKSLKNVNPTPIEIVEENFYNVLTKLPRIMNETDLAKKVNTLNLLIGYLRILGPNNFRTVLQSSSHLKRLVLSLIHVAQLERSNISLFEEHAIRDFEIVHPSPVTWKQFTYINENPLLFKFQIILQLISESDAIDILVDHLCDVFTNVNENRNEAIFLLNELIAVKVDNIENRMNIIDRIFNMYLEEENWYLPLSVENSEETENNSSVSLFNVHNNIIQTCLLVEGIGNMAKALEEHFKPFLFKALYVVLERAGSAQPLISAAGFLTLLNISKACCYQNVTSLIVDNTDYFSFHVGQKLKKLERNPSVLDVLNVVMNYSTIDVLPSIMDIINKVLLQSCDKYQIQNSTAFLKVFLSFIINLKRWLNLDNINENKHINMLMSYQKTMEVLYALYSDYVEDFTKMNTEDLTEDLSNDEIEQSDSDYNTKPEPPDHIKLLVFIMKRSLNFLPSKDLQQKLIVLDILKHGIKIISQWENELLPLVHLIWSPLIGRFKEFSDPLVINRSFDLLTVLATTSKDFIKHRTSKDVFCEICTTLKKLSEQSYLKDRGSAYRYTQSYKLQLNVLKNLAELITNLEMFTNDVTLAMEACLPYLSNKQPIPLQESAIHFYKTLAYYDFDGVWLFLINIYGVKKIREAQISQDNEKNVESILKILNLAKW